VDERDGKGREGKSDGSSNDAVVKQLFKIDLHGAVDVSDEDGLIAAKHPDSHAVDFQRQRFPVADRGRAAGTESEPVFCIRLHG